MGPLKGIKVVEFAGIGPGPFCAMMLADMGAEVLRIDRKEGNRYGKFEVLGRGRRSVVLDLKRPEGIAAALKLIENADAIIEGFRPGVMERLGLGGCARHADRRRRHGYRPGPVAWHGRLRRGPGRPPSAVPREPGRMGALSVGFGVRAVLESTS